jgi:hypothetical protein
MKHDEQDKLWEMLGKAERPSVSPFFARNVLRAIRQEPEARPSLSARIFGPVRRLTVPFAVAGTCVIAAVVAFSPSISLRHHHSSNAKALSVAGQIAVDPDYEVINHLDELVADEENSLWLDDTNHDVK